MRDRFSSNALGRMGRRGFLKTLAGLGVSASTASALTQSAVAEAVDDPRREVPRIRAFKHTNHEEVVEEGSKPEREPDVYTIPRWRWARIEAAHDARRRIEHQLNSEYPVWVTTDNNGEKKVVVEQPDDGNLRSADVRALDKKVPASMKGVAGRRSRSGRRSRFAQEREIPVDIERPKAEPSMSREMQDGYGIETNHGVDMSNHLYWDDWNDNIPGGAACQLNLDRGIEAVGTLCTPVVAKDGTRQMVTAGHNITIPQSNSLSTNSISGSVPEGQADFTPDQEEATGSAGPEVFDAAALNTTNGSGVHYEFATQNESTTDMIWGTALQDRLNDIEDNGTRSNETFVRKGARTGSNEGFGIDEVGSNGFRPSLDENQTDRGDSGGPYYLRVDLPYIDWKVSYVAGVHQGDSGLYPTTVATSMYRVEERFEVTV